MATRGNNPGSTFNLAPHSLLRTSSLSSAFDLYPLPTLNNPKTKLGRRPRSSFPSFGLSSVYGFILLPSSRSNLVILQ